MHVSWSFSHYVLKAILLVVHNLNVQGKAILSADSNQSNVHLKMGVIYCPYTLRKFVCSHYFICEFFHLFLVVGSFIGLDPENVLISEEALLIIGKTIVLQIYTTLEPRLTFNFLEDYVSSANTSAVWYITSKVFSPHAKTVFQSNS